jgi:hypothetical protein
MLEMLIIIVVVLAIAIVFILGLASRKPDTFTVRRSALVQAPAERIFPLVNDFHQWGGWSPWENKDPAMKRTYSGAESGKGAVYAWDGNKNVGSGTTSVDWVMHGPAPFMHRVMQVFMDLDKMIGKDFEAGLASLKSLAEK